MAKISAHGTEIGTVFFTTSAKRYMSDRTILKNSGFGWKLAGKVKEGVTPQDAFAAQVERQKKMLADRPAIASYRAALHDLAPLCKRWKLHAAVTMMPEDADGVWSEVCDGYSDNIHADVDEIAALCRAYQVALIEAGDVAKALRSRLQRVMISETSARRLLRLAISQSPSLRQWAAAHGLSPGYVSDVCVGRSPIGPVIRAALKLRRVTGYERLQQGEEP